MLTRVASVLWLLSAVLWAACSGPSTLDAPDAGRSATYAADEPAFDLDARALATEAPAGLEVVVGFPPATLVYTQEGIGFRARYAITVEVLDAEGRTRLHTRTRADTLRSLLYEGTGSYRSLVYEERLPLPPGRYLVTAVLTDEEAGRSATRRLRVDVPAPDVPAVGRLRLDVRRPEPVPLFEPLVSLWVPAGFTGLHASVEVTAPPLDAQAVVRLLRLRRDTTFARPPFWLAPAAGSLEGRGVDLDGPPEDTVFVATQPVAAAGEVGFDVPPPGEGIYRAEVEVPGIGATRRVFAVRSPGFPYLATVDALIDALAYLATPRELAFIREGATPEERRRRFDAFWGALLGERRTASRVVRTWYERVEEANVRFTSHKDGWRTDRGMIYVVFGPPVYVETTPLQETWHYGASQEALSTFVFERPTGYGGSHPGFEPFVLQRSAAYEPVWRRILQRWRDGSVL
ncbi:MAG TPA: GWxTD domain-containing protein [Rubricoccaceae bacterium]|nr:GWxTD domain-containing protein [Rubricoccaceae bacterium]